MKSVSDWIIPLFKCVLLVWSLAIMGATLYVAASVRPTPDPGSGHTIGIITHGRTYYFTSFEAKLATMAQRGLVAYVLVLFLSGGAHVLVSRLKDKRRSGADRD